MQIVSARWYQLYSKIMLSLSLGIFVISIVAWIVPPLHVLQKHYGFSPALIALVMVYILYAFLIYPYVVKRFSYWLATFCACMVFALNQLYLIEHVSHGILAYVYIAPWIAMGAFSGIFGFAIVLAWSFLTLVSVAAHASFSPHDIQASEYVWLLGTFGLGMAFYWLWRQLYTHTEVQRINQLIGFASGQEAQSRSLIESISDGVVVVNNQGHITLINPAAAAMTGWKLEDAISLDVRLVVKFAQENGRALTDQDPFTRILHDSTRITETLQLANKAGTSTIVSLVISPIIPTGSHTPVGLVAVIRDVSVEYQKEQQRAEFISTASHEMRTPVAAIEGYLALALNDKVSTIDSRGREYLEKAHISTQHLGKLFQDLLTSAKAEDGRLSSHPVVVEIGDYLEHLVADLRFAAQKKSLGVEFVVDSGGLIDASKSDTLGGTKVVRPLYYVHADPDRMREVVTNLFDNAVKYTEQGKIIVGLTGDDNVVQFYIRDTGAGIPADDIPHLFQKFYRVDNSTTRTIGGTGLGLFICKKIVELYNGQLWAESKLGSGSTFYINLPRLTSQKATELQNNEASENMIQPLTSLKSS